MTTQRKLRGRQLLPTRTEVRQYIETLRRKADEGDPLAIAALLQLSMKGGDECQTN